MAVKKILGREGRVGGAVAALPVHFQPVAGELELTGSGYAVQLPLNIAAVQILGFAAVNAKQVMMMAMPARVVQLVMERAIRQHYPAEDAGLHQQFQGPVHGSPADARQFPPQFLGGKVAVLAGNSRHHLAARFGIPVTLFLQGFQQLVGQGIVAIPHGLHRHLLIPHIS